MLTFEYKARDPATGQKVSAQVQANNEGSAAKLIREEGLSPLEIYPKGQKRQNPISKFRGRIKSKEKIIFSRQLSTLINAGLPLVQSLRNVVDQTTNSNFKVIINKIIADVEGGSPLADAMAKHPKVFNDVYINLIAAGEASGTLDKALLRVANQQEKEAEIISKVRGALAYPAVVVAVMIGVVVFMIVAVLPQVQLIYRDIPGATLPIITRILLAISNFITSYWWLVLILLALAIFFTTKWARTGKGKDVVDKAKMRAWPIGNLFMKVYMARFARTGETLVSSGMPLLQTLDITSKSINNVHIARSLQRARDQVKGGKALSDSLEGDPNFLPLVPNMLRVGEQSGSIEEMLGKTADYYEREVDNEIKTISTIIEPVMMILLGIVAFIIVAAILLPIYGLAGQTIIR